MKKRFLFSIFLSALILLSSCSAKPRNVSASELAKLFDEAGLRLLKEGVTPRDFSLSTAAGETFTLSDLKGSVVFLNFWATWCGPCRSEMPSMEILYNRFKDQGLEILAVNCMEEPEEVLDFMKSYGLSFPAPLDIEGKVGGPYGIQAIPTTYLIDREGKIILRLVGSIDWDTPEIHTAMEALLNATS
jgi:thiol-disulfide isomerase/thioredoxin